MSRCQSHPAWFALGALSGAAIALLLVPETRRAVQAGFRRVLFELGDGDFLVHEGITEEAGAVEGGLAATRIWRESVSS